MIKEHSICPGQRVSLGKLLAHLLGVGVMAVAACAGAGIGTAAADIDATVSSEPTVSSDHLWTLKNDTDQAIYGTWEVQVGSDVSKLTRKDWDTLASRNTAYQFNPFYEPYKIIVHHEYWRGHICYDHKQWNLNNLKTDTEGFTLTAKSDLLTRSNVLPKKLSAQWTDTSGWPDAQHTVELTENVAEGRC
ncbi:hypothetical protein R3Q06_32275 [Rhodococcus erythropolis]|uniref:hypothetical protein n=1 Tax=Rhodococcus erythropolis TaxID=1833 RepID=UPI002949F996|nr:hypothetical protein [Rhodococcus erythropolis]MDV6278150.1 hypothetical protein [Rhodococcus erythropolis]